jgi:hypothetical protein
MHAFSRTGLSAGAMLVALAIGGCSSHGNAVSSSAKAEPPPTDCRAWVGTDRNQELPGYRLPQSNGETVCVPLGVNAFRPPAGYAGGDYHVDEFTDARLKERWRACKTDTACFARIDAQMQRWLPPNKARSTRSTGVVDPSGKIDPDGTVDLRQIRRPAFFAKAPYEEGIARADASTYVVEFTVPPDTFERIDLKMTDPIKLRGWYIEGRGVEDGKGGKMRALVVMAPGGGGQLTAIQHPGEKAYRIDPATGRAVDVKFPNATTETMGQRWWRENLDALNQAGFDVLAYDRRGEGISGGFSDTNTLEQGEDVFRVLAQLDTGNGLRLLTPDARVLAGSEAAGKLLGGMASTRIPILLGGYSRGSMSTRGPWPRISRARAATTCQCQNAPRPRGSPTSRAPFCCLRLPAAGATCPRRPTWLTATCFWAAWQRTITSCSIRTRHPSRACTSGRPHSSAKASGIARKHCKAPWPPMTASVARARSWWPAHPIRSRPGPRATGSTCASEWLPSPRWPSRAVPRYRAQSRGPTSRSWSRPRPTRGRLRRNPETTQLANSWP